MNLIEAMDIVCNKIPEGYSVVLRINRDGCDVELETPDGVQTVSSDSEDLIGKVLSASDQAIDDNCPA